MAQQVEGVNNQLAQQTPPSLPVISSLAAPEGRIHRIVIYRSLPSTRQALQFVGFVSKRHADTPEPVLTSLQDVDSRLVVELAEQPGLLNYSSLELAHGIWYNLVIFVHTEVKGAILGLKTHQFAAYGLAPSYYQWIRLHHGVIAGGHLSDELTLTKTKYYTFHTFARQPDTRIQVYEPLTVTE